MKNCILKGLCVIFILSSLVVMMIPGYFAAQDGHGGSTEVIAHVEAQTDPPPTDSVSPTEPLTEPFTPAGSQPVQTGEVVAWVAFIVLLLSAALLLILRLKKE